MRLSAITSVSAPASRASSNGVEDFPEAYAKIASEPRVPPSFNPLVATMANPYSDVYGIDISRHHGHGGYQAKSGALVQFGDNPTAALGELVAAIAVMKGGSPFTIQINA